MVCVLIFAVIVVPLSLLDLSEQALLHTALGILTITMIIAYCVIKLSLGKNQKTSAALPWNTMLVSGQTHLIHSCFRLYDHY